MVFGLTRPHVAHVVTERKIPMCRKYGVLVVQLVMRPNTKAVKDRNDRREGIWAKRHGFQVASVRTIRCEAQMKVGKGEEGGTMRIEGVEDQERTVLEKASSREDCGHEQEAEGAEEIGRRKMIRMLDTSQPQNERQLSTKRRKTAKFVCSTVALRKWKSEWVCRRPVKWLREIGLDFIGVIARSDNEPALTSLVDFWSHLRAMKGGSRMIAASGGATQSAHSIWITRAVRTILERERWNRDSSSTLDRESVEGEVVENTPRRRSTLR